MRSDQSAWRSMEGKNQLGDAAAAESDRTDAQDCEDGRREGRRAMFRELSFSQGISSVSPRSLEAAERESTANADDSAFSFVRLADEHNNGVVASESWQRKHDDFQISDGKISDEEFEREFGDGSISKFDDEFEVTSLKREPHLFRTVVITLAYILLWYTFSTALTLYNKLLLGKKYGKFPAPLMMNTIHFTMQAVLSSVLLRFCFATVSPPSLRSWKEYFLRVVPAGVATALDVDLTNASLVFITVTFVTMCKSATPVFLLIFAFIFKIEKPSLKLFGIILVISFGVLLTVTKATEFNILGFCLVMLAALSSGFRWVVTQLLLQREEYGLNNPLAAMSYLTPIMAVITAVFSLILEPWSGLARSEYFNSMSHMLESFLLMLLGGTLAFCMVMAEYILISKTSAVTMTVAGVVKEIVTIIVAILYFKDPFTLLRGFGLVIIIVGVGLFNWFKYTNLRSEDAASNVEMATTYSVLKEEV